MDFEEWKTKLDKLLVAYCWLQHDDLPDWDWWEQYSCGEEPKEAIKVWHGEMAEELGLPDLSVGLR